MHKYMTVKMPDGSVFGVLVEMVAIPSPGKTTVSKEEAERRFAEVRAVLGKKIVNQ